MTRSAISIPCGELTLEGAWHEATAGPAAGVVIVCHPHPLYGGDQDNHVVQGIARAIAGCGLAVLTFNFRGVGASGGTHGNGVAEQDDVRAAIDFATARGAGPIGLAGYSFGARLAAEVAVREPRVAALALISPTFRTWQFPEPDRFDRPVLVALGDDDEYGSVEAAEALVGLLQRGKLKVVEDGDHFWSFGGDATFREIADFFAETMRRGALTE
ncbi:MAG: alpha/beta fold hydrolase [Chloroflexi bacterium]|nr:alpha/beta fold hydrolase [Chloroflexota bacterium]